VFGLSEVVDSGKLRFIVIDGSTVQEPGATATTYRLHIAVDLINLSLHQVEITTDKETATNGYRVTFMQSPCLRKKPPKRGAKPNNAAKTKDVNPAQKPFA